MSTLNSTVPGVGTRFDYGEQMKKNQIDEVWSIHGNIINACKVAVRKLEGDNVMDGRIILKCILV
jgi:hypothetical protein